MNSDQTAGRLVAQGSAGEVPDGTDELRLDGGHVHIRTLEASDLASVRALHLGVSDQSSYFRFFGVGRKPALDYLPRLMARATGNHQALVATVEAEIIGVASFERGGSGPAEVSLLVADKWQHDGIGTLLLEHLASVARHAGVHTFVAETLSENNAITEVLRALGYQMKIESDCGTMISTFDLEPVPPAAAATAERRHRAEVALDDRRAACTEMWSTS